MRTSEVLERAAELIERDGWWQNARSDGHGDCAATAISRVAEGRGGCYVPAVHDPFIVALGGDKDAPMVTTIYNWNDVPGRTKEEVIAMLRAVAATERARESGQRVPSATSDAGQMA